MFKKVYIKFSTIQAETDKAYLIKNNWFSKKLCKIENNMLIMPEWVAQEKGLKYKFVYHIPDKIEPIYNQEAIKELIY